jgi:hypothetical protein
LFGLIIKLTDIFNKSHITQDLVSISANLKFSISYGSTHGDKKDNNPATIAVKYVGAAAKSANFST